MLDSQTVFQQQFGYRPAQVVRAPGRLELLGNHTDYNLGLVMALAINRYIHIACAPRQDGKIEIASSAFPLRDSFSVSNIEKNPAAPWANYVKGVLLQLRQRGVQFGGFNAAIHGTIPLGAGMSSSAALEVATALAIRQLYPYTLTESGLGAPPQRNGDGHLAPMTLAEKMSLAKLCQAAENQYVGVKCGLLDQISSLFGQANHVIQIDCLTLAVELTPMVAGVAIVVCASGVHHALLDGAYNELRQQCESAARALGVTSLRQVELAQLQAQKARLTEREYQCAHHIVGENHRVVFGARALRANDLQQFGQYLFQSHASSQNDFKNSCPELDRLVAQARTHPACLGARLTGGGFGGATINLVEQTQTADFCQFMAVQHEKATGHKLEPVVCEIVDGAQ